MVTSPIQERLLESLPLSLQRDAEDLSADGVNEYGFPIAVADEVFVKLVENGFQVLGGDLWRRDSGEFVFWNAGWSSGGPDQAEEHWRSFCSKVSGLEFAYVTFVVKH